ncbi:MAG: MarC family protein [Mesorhizobium sp.]|nr:MarC family protein [Mesorhizobium sp.]MBL8579877.1 MarC family protein [Mesorhizobium sp.]
MDIQLFARALGALFAIMNPFVALPIFLALTTASDVGTVRKLAIAATVAATVMCAVVAIAGGAILDFFGITINDFRLAGGLVLLLIGLGMLNGTDSETHHRAPDQAAGSGQDSSIAFYPMAFPMIVGPGTIATILIFTSQANTAEQRIAVGAAIACVLASVGVVLFLAPLIGHYMSQTLRVITTRLMGMILAAIAVGMMADGLKALLPGLG